MSDKAIKSREGDATDLFPLEFPFGEEDEPSQSSDQTSDGSPGEPPQGPPQGPGGSGSDPRDPRKAGGSNFSHKAGMACATVIGGALAVGSVPVVLGAMGFTGAGIAASSLAAKMMSAAAVANGGGVAAGSLVATLQSVGAAGLSMSSNVILGSAGSALGAWLWGSKKKAPSSPPPGSSTEAERDSRAGDDPPGPQDVSPPNDKFSAS
ncbi:interferon alpha-inducible protein 27-like protein 2 [Physeter macrocephalus]|uniref:Interferon alpha-inducible protein 27-like protein 2 n=1 Tax=Physeter macrocephalus TaxID=9755 RepID=A0A455B2S9_PHYMC|nr:interferon alpha-inducible protein 27-like protein 2 [Physeter catodon]|eukprot:XP_028343082.1 interferon alpha-inducible protein 27-like protein 2 [Physeter catodon]